jgi:hypothetical protein
MSPYDRGSLSLAPRIHIHVRPGDRPRRLADWSANQSLDPVSEGLVPECLLGWVNLSIISVGIVLFIDRFG